VTQLGHELGVRYVLEGSVRKAGSRVRITGQLIDTSTGGHLWADRFEGELEDIFDLQDRVTVSVVSAIAPKLESAEIERAKRKPPANLDAYDYYLRGMACLYRWTKEANAEALALFYQAIERDPEFAAAYGMAARCYSQRKTSGWMVDRKREIAETERLARRAGECGKDDAVALSSAGISLAFVVGDLASGADFTDRALALNPNLAWAWLFGGLVKNMLGEPELALERVALAMRLSPHDFHIYNMHGALAWAHFLAGRYAEALSWAQTAVREQPNLLFATCVAAASAALGGQLAEARKAMDHVRELDPTLRLSNLGNFLPTRRPEDFAKWQEAMRKAGLPE